MNGRSRRLLLVEDERLLGRSIQKYLNNLNHHCDWKSNSEEAILLLKQEAFDLVISDIRLPGSTGIELMRWIMKNQDHLPVILITAHSSVKEAVEAIREGASDYICKPLDLETLELSIKRVLETQKLKREVLFHRAKSDQEFFFWPDSELHRELQVMVQRLIEIEEKTNVTPTVFITGETGTGKGMLARKIHEQSSRREGLFIALNCNAIPESMFESELFGHEKGAFTGALQQRTGMFELAEGGTLFLDEIGHLPLPVQSKFLKVLEDKTLRRIGGTREYSIDVRIIAATNLDLNQAIEQGEFREDLFHRLNVVNLKMPPLRETPEVLTQLTDHLLEQSLKKYPGSHNPLPTQSSGENLRRHFISKSGMKNLQAYHWPGNFRELKNEIERMVIFFQGNPLDYQHLNYLDVSRRQTRPLQKEVEESEDSFFELPEEGIDLSELEPLLVSQALFQSEGKVYDAANLLKMTVKQFEFLISKYESQIRKDKMIFRKIPESGVHPNNLENTFIKQAMERSGNNVTSGARLLNLSRDQMRYRLRKHEISMGKNDQE